MRRSMFISLVLFFLIATTTITTIASAGTQNPYELKSHVVNAGIILSWKKPSVDGQSVTGYQILRRERSSEFSLLVYEQNTGSTNPVYIDRFVEEGLTYNYRVKAIRPNGLSGRSNYVRVSFVFDFNLIVGGQSVEAELSGRSEKDWYSVWLESGQRYKFYVGGLGSGYTLDPPVLTGLYDSDKTRINACRNYHSNAGLYSLDAIAVITAPYTGKFFVNVNSAGFSQGTYFISVK